MSGKVLNVLLAVHAKEMHDVFAIPEGESGRVRRDRRGIEKWDVVFRVRPTQRVVWLTPQARARLRVVQREAPAGGGL